MSAWKIKIKALEKSMVIISSSWCVISDRSVWNIVSRWIVWWCVIGGSQRSMRINGRCVRDIWSWSVVVGWRNVLSWSMNVWWGNELSCWCIIVSWVWWCGNEFSRSWCYDLCRCCNILCRLNNGWLCNEFSWSCYDWSCGDELGGSNLLNMSDKSVYWISGLEKVTKIIL